MLEIYFFSWYNLSMGTFWIIFSIIAFIVLGFVISVIIVGFLKVFYSPKRIPKDNGEYDLPPGKMYDKFIPVLKQATDFARNYDYKEYNIKSFDGKFNLNARYYEKFPNAPIELMLHGYRGSGERDLCIGIERAFKVGRNAFIVDHRGAGRSDGNVISFGINEYKDSLKWLDFIINEFGKDVKIVITGISMGASTALMMAGTDLPKNVIGVLADCGFTSPKAIIKKVVTDMKLPAGIIYPFIRFAGILSGFDIEETSAIESVKKAKVPIIFIHGEDDDFVPASMSKDLFNACASSKKLLIVKGAGHGSSYMVDPKTYVDTVKSYDF